MNRQEASALIARVIRALEEFSVEAYIVGGAIRDVLLSEDVSDDASDSDIDFTLEVTDDAVAKQCIVGLHAELGGHLKEFPKFLTAKIADIKGFETISEVDIAMCRTEVYKKPGALPTVSLSDLNSDLGRRDFTVNALAMRITDFQTYLDGQLDDISERVVDLYGGKADLDERLLRTLHAKSFIDDPTRIFRAVRYCSRIGAQLENETDKQMREAIRGGALATISKQRVINELIKIFNDRDPQSAIELLNERAVLEQVFPEMRVGDLVVFARRWSLLRPPQSAQAGCFQFVLYSTGLSQAGYLGELGIGKKLAARMAEIVAEKDTVSYATESDTTLLWRHLAGSSSEGLLSELRSREFLE